MYVVRTARSAIIDTTVGWFHASTPVVAVVSRETRQNRIAANLFVSSRPIDAEVMTGQSIKTSFGRCTRDAASKSAAVISLLPPS